MAGGSQAVSASYQFVKILREVSVVVAHGADAEVFSLAQSAC